MSAENLRDLLARQEPTEMYTAEDASLARQESKPSFLAPLFSVPLQRRTRSHWPWRHTTCSCLLNEPLLKKMAAAEGVSLEAIVTRQRAMAMLDFCRLLENNFREDTGRENVEGWRLVVLKGGWLKNTTVVKSDDDTILYIDASYFFEKVA